MGTLAATDIKGGDVIRLGGQTVEVFDTEVTQTGVVIRYILNGEVWSLPAYVDATFVRVI